MVAEVCSAARTTARHTRLLQQRRGLVVHRYLFVAPLATHAVRGKFVAAEPIIKIVPLIGRNLRLPTEVLFLSRRSHRHRSSDFVFAFRVPGIASKNR
jgi:hypothetical protein